MTVERVHYFNGQYLRVDDFADEQAYHVAMRRKHNIAQHSWGIVVGLELALGEDGLSVSPGLAVDGYGRELLLETRRLLPLHIFDDYNTDRLEVRMHYATRLEEPPPAGYADPHAHGGAGEQMYRLVEEPGVRLVLPDPQGPQAGRTFAVTDDAPEDGSWPILLGTARRSTDGQKQTYSLDATDRVYAGLVGEEIRASSGAARVQLGQALDDGEAPRFAVHLPAEAKEPSLAMAADGTTTWNGDTTVHGDLTVSGGALEIGVGPASSPQPWRLYRVPGTEVDAGGRNQLRMEMAGGTDGNNQVVVGTWSAKDAQWKPCLTVADDGTVTVSGNLVVQGKLEVTPEQWVPGALTPEAKAYLDAARMANVATGRAKLTPALLAESPGLASPANVSPAVAKVQLQEAATLLAHPNEEHLNQFAQLLKTDFSDAAAKLKKLLEH